MKIKSNPNNAKIFAANGKTLRHDGMTFLVRAQKLGPVILADAECFHPKMPLINLFGKDKLARELRKIVEVGAVS